MSDQNIAIRLKFLIEELGISNSQFADECNISRPTLSQLVTGRNKKVSDVIISQIHKAYPNLSVLWLLFGEGEMWNGLPPQKGIENLNSNVDFDPASSSVDGANDEDLQTANEKINSGPKNPCDNPEIPTSCRDNLKYSKENPVNSGDFTIQESNNKEVNALLKNAEFLNDLAKIKGKPKKVVHVTIYYDDSTFETFYPGK